MLRIGLFLVGFLTIFAGFGGVAAAAPVSQATDCQFVLGFKTLHNLIPKTVGNCVTDEQYNANGDGLQQTVNGLLVWRKADNFTAFTDGYRTWVNGPLGLQERLNTQRFPWEKKAATVTKTEVIKYVPPTTTSKTISGDCFTTSVATSRTDAYRCMARNLIYDPCFTVPGKSGEVVCVRNPLNSKSIVTMTLTKPLPAPPPGATMQRQHPWFLELADGTVCNFFTGATGAVNGERLNYGCSDGWDIVGEPQTGTVWKVHEVQLAPRSFHVLNSADTEVKTVWQ